MSRDRARAAERLLAELGVDGVRVRACGHEETIAALRVPDAAWEAVLARAGELSRQVRSLGFRYVTLDLDARDGAE